MPRAHIRESSARDRPTVLPRLGACPASGPGGRAGPAGVPGGRAWRTGGPGGSGGQGGTGGGDDTVAVAAAEDTGVDQQGVELVERDPGPPAIG